MQIIKTLPIGTEVYYFDPLLEDDIEIFKSVVLGCFVNKNEGELYYQMINKQSPAWCVSDTKEGVEILKRAFLNYREKLQMANAANKVRYNELREGTVFEEYKVTSLPTEEKIGEDNEQSEITEVNE